MQMLSMFYSDRKGYKAPSCLVVSVATPAVICASNVTGEGTIEGLDPTLFEDDLWGVLI